MVQELLIPSDHPRRVSLEIRDRLVECFRKGMVVEQGLIAHGRGEAYDYLIGEKTTSTALKAIKTAVASLLLAKEPVLSVNGNVACLCSKEIANLAEIINAKIEINIFYRSKERIKIIEEELKRYYSKKIYGVEENDYTVIQELSSARRVVDKYGIYSSDVVLVPLEDGDRTEALVKMGKKVIAIDLNPLSRTSITAQISIVDNIIRVIPLMIKYAQEYSRVNRDELQSIIDDFDNKSNLEESLRIILRGIR